MLPVELRPLNTYSGRTEATPGWFDGMVVYRLAGLHSPLMMADVYIHADIDFQSKGT